jgi:hypothetical protein
MSAHHARVFQSEPKYLTILCDKLSAALMSMQRPESSSPHQLRTALAPLSPRKFFVIGLLEETARPLIDEVPVLVHPQIYYPASTS